jgi:hypothetical protein
MPDFRWRRLQSGNGNISLNIKYANVAVDGSGGGDFAGRMSGDGDNSETMAGVSMDGVSEVVGVPEAHCLVE